MRSPVRIVSTCLPALAAAALTAACGIRSTAPIEARGEAVLDGRPAVPIRVVAQPEHRQYAHRYVSGAIAAVLTIDRAFGGYGGPAVVLVDPDLQGRTPPVADAVVLPPVPWWTTTTAMAPELAAARAVSRRFWNDALNTGSLPLWFRDGMTELIARRATASVFQDANLAPGYAFMEQRFFAGFVPRFVRIRLAVESAGAVNAAYRAMPHVAAAEVPAGAERDALAGKSILAVVTLERWLGSPTLDEILARFVEAARQRPVRLEDFEQMAWDISGQNLSWFFDQAFRGSDDFDFGIDELTSERDSDQSYITAVRARRYGDALFTGTAAPRVGAFESGRGLMIQVAFADGGQRTDYWDGRDREKTFRYRSASPAVSAVLDPGGVLLLDVKRTNNSRTVMASTSAAAAWMWAARYALWAQNLLLTYASLV